MLTNIVIVSLLIDWYFVGRKFITNEKQRAWIITLTISLILSFYGLYMFIKFIYNQFSIEFLLNYKLSYFEMLSHHLFSSYLLLDLVIGLIDYPKQINLMTGWVHHIMYLIICYFYQNTRYSALIMLCYIVEIPTFILGLCKFYPQVDLLKHIFTNIFFIFRICGLGSITIKCIMIGINYGIDYGVMLSLILSMCLNSYWFLKMIKYI